MRLNSPVKQTKFVNKNHIRRMQDIKRESEVKYKSRFLLLLLAGIEIRSFDNVTQYN
jgi:hypothetical protein